MTRSVRNALQSVEKIKSYSLPSEREGEATIETSASGADAMVRVRLKEPRVF
jgi:hypothetical protein